MIFNLGNIMQDPLRYLLSLLLMLPGAMLAISIHESAHGWVAEKCGDPTARYAGRITLNPVKHFDPLGFLCILFVGFGWAKPVPVNPLMYKNYRRDDIKVSLAGITANLCLFLLCFIILACCFYPAVGRLDDANGIRITDTDDGYNIQYFRGQKEGLFVVGEGDGEFIVQYDGAFTVVPTSNIMYAFASLEMSQALFGKVPGIILRMVLNCMMINLSLAVFNLIPLPPLDGYHVLNDLVLKQDLFAQRRTQQISGMVLLALIMLGNVNSDWDIIGIAINWVRTSVTGGLSALSRTIAVALGVI